jgi:toxin CptA
MEAGPWTRKAADYSGDPFQTFLPSTRSSAMQDSSSLRLRIGPSRSFAVVLTAVHGVAAAIPWSVGMPPLLAAAMSCVVAGWGVVQVRRHALGRSPDSVVEILLEDEGRARLLTNAGIASGGRVVEARTLGPWFVFLRFELDDGPMVGAALARDRCTPEDFRRLRVRVRWVLPSAVEAAPQADAIEHR